VVLALNDRASDALVGLHAITSFWRGDRLSSPLIEKSRTRLFSGNSLRMRADFYEKSAKKTSPAASQAALRGLFRV